MHFSLRRLFASSRSHIPKTLSEKLFNIQRVFVSYEKNIYFLSLFIKVSYLHGSHSSPLLPVLYWWHLHTNTYFCLPRNAAPLIYHVFNVEQDQVIRDNKSIFGQALQSERSRETEIKTKASQSHELSREMLDGTHRFAFPSFSLSPPFGVTFGYENFFFSSARRRARQ